MLVTVSAVWPVFFVSAGIVVLFSCNLVHRDNCHGCGALAKHPDGDCLMDVAGGCRSGAESRGHSFVTANCGVMNLTYQRLLRHRDEVV